MWCYIQSTANIKIFNTPIWLQKYQLCWRLLFCKQLFGNSLSIIDSCVDIDRHGAHWICRVYNSVSLGKNQEIVKHWFIKVVSKDCIRVMRDPLLLTLMSTFELAPHWNRWVFSFRPFVFHIWTYFHDCPWHTALCAPPGTLGYCFDEPVLNLSHAYW